MTEEIEKKLVTLLCVINVSQIDSIIELAKWGFDFDAASKLYKAGILGNQSDALKELVNVEI